MAVGPVGNMLYINQSSSVTSSIHASNMSHQTPANANVFQEQMQRIVETRRTEHTGRVEDRDSGSNGKSGREQQHGGRSKQDENEDISEDTMLMRPETRILDIKG